MRLSGLGKPLVKSALFVVVTVAATFVLGATIANQGGGDTTAYAARFTDASSVNPGDDVRMAGVRVGQVDAVTVVDRRFAEVRFSVRADRRLTADVAATIKYRNLIGQRYLALTQGTSGSLAAGATIPVERTRPALDLTALFNGFRPLFQALSPQDVNTLSQEIIQVLQGEGGTVDGVLRHTASLTSGLADHDELIGRVIGNLNTVLAKVNTRDEQLASLVGTAHELVTGLAKDAEPIGEAIDGMAALTASTADLLRQGRQPLKDDITALGLLSRDLAEGTPAFESFLGNLPGKYESIGRISSYGTWMNFYLCMVESDARPAPGGGPVGVPLTDARCRR